MHRKSIGHPYPCAHPCDKMNVMQTKGEWAWKTVKKVAKVKTSSSKRTEKPIQGNELIDFLRATSKRSSEWNGKYLLRLTPLSFLPTSITYKFVHLMNFALNAIRSWNGTHKQSVFMSHSSAHRRLQSERSIFVEIPYTRKFICYITSYHAPLLLHRSNRVRAFREYPENQASIVLLLLFLENCKIFQCTRIYVAKD